MGVVVCVSVWPIIIVVDNYSNFLPNPHTHTWYLVHHKVWFKLGLIGIPDISRELKNRWPLLVGIPHLHDSLNEPSQVGDGGTTNRHVVEYLIEGKILPVKIKANTVVVGRKTD